MIRMLIFLPFIALIAVVIAWSGLALSGGDSAILLDREAEALFDAYPDSERHRELFAEASAMAKVADPMLARLDPRASVFFAAGAVIVGVHILVVLRSLPVLLTLLALGFLLGLLFRERLRQFDHADQHASPTVSHLAKFVLAGALLYIAIFCFAPIGVPYWTLYAAFLVASLGGTLYVANLPINL